MTDRPRHPQGGHAWVRIKATYQAMQDAETAQQAARHTLATLLAQARRGITAKVNDNDYAQADAVIAAGWRPPVHENASTEILEALPYGSIVTDHEGDAWQRHPYGWICAGNLADSPDPLNSVDLIVKYGAITVVHQGSPPWWTDPRDIPIGVAVTAPIYTSDTGMRWIRRDEATFTQIYAGSSPVDIPVDEMKRHPYVQIQQ